MHSFKLDAKRLGTHTHVRVFCGRQGSSRGFSGRLIFRNEEWVAFRDALRGGMPGSKMPEVLEERITELEIEEAGRSF